MPISGRGAIEVAGNSLQLEGYSYEPWMDGGRKRFRGEIFAASPSIPLAVFNVHSAVLIEDDGQRMRIVVLECEGGNSAPFIGDRI